MNSGDFDAWVRRAKAVPIQEELARRGINLNGRSGDQCGPCPRCGGTDRFAINVHKQVFNCRGCGVKGDIIDLVRALDNCGFVEACSTLTDEPPPPRTNGKDEAPEATKVVVATFSYQDANGALLFQVQRLELRYSDGSFVLGKDGKHKKTFRQRRPIPDQPGQWIWSVHGTHVPYRLPELIEAMAARRTVLITEGEGPVDLLLGWNIAATTNAGGAKKWRKEHSAFLKGADVVVVPDNDEQGREHAEMVAVSLAGVAAHIRILTLPNLPEKGDVIDWAEAGGSADQLLQLIQNAPD
jgi:hypothetical protein